MSKLEESVNEILGLEGKDKVIDKTELEPPKEFKAPVQRKNGEVQVKIDKDINNFNKLIEKRSLGSPIAYLTNSKSFLKSTVNL